MNKSMGYIAVSMSLVLGYSSLTFAKSHPKPYGYTLCKTSGFHCVRVKKGDTWKRLFPDKMNREIVKRINRTNAPLYRFTHIAVPDRLERTNHLDHSPYPDQIEARGHNFLFVQLHKLAFAAYDKNGALVHWGPISGGKDRCSDSTSCKTVTGDFKIYRKQGAGCVSSKYPLATNGGAPMPYCMHFYRGYAIHGSTLPGYHASHGCVRLFASDAKWLNEHFANMGMRVIVEE